MDRTKKLRTTADHPTLQHFLRPARALLRRGSDLKVAGFIDDTFVQTNTSVPVGTTNRQTGRDYGFYDPEREQVFTVRRPQSRRRGLAACMGVFVLGIFGWLFPSIATITLTLQLLGLFVICFASQTDLRLTTPFYCTIESLNDCVAYGLLRQETLNESGRVLLRRQDDVQHHFSGDLNGHEVDIFTHRDQTYRIKSDGRVESADRSTVQNELLKQHGIETCQDAFPQIDWPAGLAS